MGKQQDWWSGEGGDAYHDRNRYDWRKRIPFWSDIIDRTAARSVLELGCGLGYNLSAIHRAQPDVVVGGIEINPSARKQAQSAKIWVQPEFGGLGADLVFTVGCLIHIPPDEIEPVMRQIIKHSYQYVLCAEYDAPTEQEIEYQGQEGLLWKRPYNEMYQDLGLLLLREGVANEDDGFDNCRWGLFEI